MTGPLPSRPGTTETGEALQRFQGRASKLFHDAREPAVDQILAVVTRQQTELELRDRLDR
jgi:hypothetical protein